LNEKRIYVITSGEFYLTGKIVLSLIKRGWAVTFVDVSVDKNSKLERKLKIALLLGPLGIMKYYFGSWYHRLILIPCMHKVTKNQVEEKLNEFIKLGEIFLVNYPEKLIINNQLKVHNCHPGKLPEYRGLMPIPRAMLESAGSDFECVSTIHLINDRFDMGYIVSEYTNKFRQYETIFYIYDQVYSKFVDQIESIMVNDKENLLFKEVTSEGVYRSSITWSELLRLKVNEIWQNQFVRFILNGGFFGLLSWLFQDRVFDIIKNYSGSSNMDMQYSISVLITFSVIVILNFASQKKLVFRTTTGSIRDFVASSLFVILIVAMLSYFFHKAFSISAYASFAGFSYPLAAIVTAPIAFFIKKRFIFNLD
jgi:hypothetical protein